MSCDLYACTWNLTRKTINAELLTVSLYIVHFLRKAAICAKYHCMIRDRLFYTATVKLWNIL